MKTVASSCFSEYVHMFVLIVNLGPVGPFATSMRRKLKKKNHASASKAIQRSFYNLHSAAENEKQYMECDWTFTWLYLWAHCCHLLLQWRGCCTHSVGWMLEVHWSPPAPWWETGWGSEAGGWAGHRQELKRGLSPHLRAGLMGDGVQPWWQAEHWPEILRGEKHKQFHLFIVYVKPFRYVSLNMFCLHLCAPVCRLTWGALRVPILRYRCQFASQLFVVVVGDRRALPAQTFRSLQPAGWRRKKSLVGRGCWGTPGKDE